MPNIILGLLALAFGLWGLSIWWWSVTELLRGLFPLLLLGVGFVALAAGITKIQHPTSKLRYGPEEDDDLLETDNEINNETKETELDSELAEPATKPKNESEAVNSEETDKKPTKVATTSKSTTKKPSIKKVITAKSTASVSSSSENKSVIDKTNTNIKNTDKK